MDPDFLEILVRAGKYNLVTHEIYVTPIGCRNYFDCLQA